MKKPLVEAMAIAYANESKRLNPMSQEWGEMDTEVQNHILACMTEVARALGYFEKEGMVVLFLKKKKPELPRDPTDEAPITAALDPMTTQGEAGTLPQNRPTTPEQEGWMICGICGQVAVVRESACRTRCHACGAIDGGCG